jgi:hypothetical protein
VADEIKDERKLEVPHLEGAIKTGTKSDLAWKIEHAGCQLGIGHFKDADKIPYTMFNCARHNANHVIRGTHERLPG